VKKKHAAGLPGSPAPSLATHAAQPHKNNAKPAENAALTKIRDVMWRLVGILRSGKELTSAMEQLRSLELPKTRTMDALTASSATCTLWLL